LIIKIAPSVCALTKFEDNWLDFRNNLY